MLGLSGMKRAQKPEGSKKVISERGKGDLSCIGNTGV